jgi:hypothetical protein
MHGDGHSCKQNSALDLCAMVLILSVIRPHQQAEYCLQEYLSPDAQGPSTVSVFFLLFLFFFTVCVFLTVALSLTKHKDQSLLLGSCNVADRHVCMCI